MKVIIKKQIFFNLGTWLAEMCAYDFFPFEYKSLNQIKLSVLKSLGSVHLGCMIHIRKRQINKLTNVLYISAALGNYLSPICP